MNTRIALVGAGLVGKQHLKAIDRAETAELVAIVDPVPATVELARQRSVPLYRELDTLLIEEAPDGVILATPNELHVEQALCCIEANTPTLVEKPLATSVEGALRIVEAGHRAGVPVLTGHHRRHNPVVAKARELIVAGELGRLVSAQATTWLYKPATYFDTPWRREPGGGPIAINLIHDIDMLRHLVGEVTRVHVMASNAIREHAVEDSCVMTLSFDNGALGTLNLSDTIAAPWSWELTAHENPAYASTSEACYLIGGTTASLALPSLSLWSHTEPRHWWQAIHATHYPVSNGDPLVRQVEQFVRVIRGEEAPLVPASEGLANQRVIEALSESARSGAMVALPTRCQEACRDQGLTPIRSPSHP